MSLLLATPVYAGVATVSLQPGNPNPERPSVFIYTVDPNQSYQDELLVANDTDETVMVHLDAVDNALTADGSFACKQDGEPKEFFGKWVAFSNQDFEMAPRERKRVPFTVNTPENIDVGEHSGCITVSKLNEDALVQSNGVRLNFRNAVGAFLTVKGEIIEKIEWSLFALERLSKDQVAILASFKNEGNVYGRIQSQLRVYNLFGREVGSFTQGGVVFRDRELHLRYMLDGLDSALLYRVEIDANYESKSGETKNLAPKKMFFLMAPNLMYGLLYGSVVMLILSFVTWRVSTRRFYKKIRQTWVMTVVKKAKSLPALAAEYHVDWALIAKVNQLKAPYDIQEGMSLLLPEISEKKDRSAKKAPKKSE